MSPRSPRIASKLIQSLRTTLQKIDEDFPSPADEPVVTGLRRLLLLRIAELDLESAGANGACEKVNAPNAQN